MSAARVVLRPDDEPYQGFDWPLVAAIAVVTLLFVALMFDVATPPPRKVDAPAPVTTSSTTTTAPAEVQMRAASTGDASPRTFTTAGPGRWVTTSTMYCLTGVTASGTTAGPGVVAVSYGNFPRLLGSTWRVLDGPMAGRVFTVEDKGPLADFDMWTGSCDEAVDYGRRTITVEQVTA